MIKNIYTGQTSYTTGSGDIKLDGPIIVKGDIIEIHTPDMTPSGYDKKLDLLFYNSINRYGEVLKSLVYASDLKEEGDISEIAYTPKTLLNNTDFEKSLEVSDESVNMWLNEGITQTSYTLLNNTSYRKVNPYNTFSITSDYAPMVSQDNYMFDGWYTFASIVLGFIADSSAVVAGTLRYNGVVVEYAIIDNPTQASDWEEITSIDSSINMFNLISPHVTRDFVVVSKTNSLYNNLSSKDLAAEWFSGIQAIKPKVRSIHANAKAQTFETCQHLINSINISLLSLIT